VLANFKQVVKDKPVRIHPLVSQLVDPAVLEKMKVRPVGRRRGRLRARDRERDRRSFGQRRHRLIQENLMFISGRVDQSSFHANADGSANAGIAA
jgi:hypothetical protein